MMEHLYKRLQNLEESVRKVQTAPTLPIVDYTRRPEDSLDAQIFIGTNNTINWFDGTTWWAQNPFDVVVNNVPEDPIEGQIVIGTDNTSLCWYSNRVWHGQVGTLITEGNFPEDSLEGQLVVGAGTAGTLAWFSNAWYGITGIV